MPNLFRNGLILGVIATCFFASAAHADQAVVTVTVNAASVAVDQPVAFAAFAADTSGLHDITQKATVTVNDPRGVMSAGHYIPGSIGTWTITATYASQSATTAVTVNPGQAVTIDVNPNSGPEVILLGASRTFTATAYDAQNNVIENPIVTWKASARIGTITSYGRFTAAHLGAGAVEAWIGTVKTRHAILVVPKPVLPVVTASPEPLVTPTTPPANTNTSPVAPTNTNSSPAATPTTATNQQCTTLQTWVWVAILVAFFAGVITLYAFIPASAIWPATLAVGTAIILAVVQRINGCGFLPWWAWVISLGTIGLTALSMRWPRRISD